VAPVPLMLLGAVNAIVVAQRSVEAFLARAWASIISAVVGWWLDSVRVNQI